MRWGPAAAGLIAASVALPVLASPGAWEITDHGGANEGNLAVGDNGIYLLSPEQYPPEGYPPSARLNNPDVSGVLARGFRSGDDGLSWHSLQPDPFPVLEGDFAAFGRHAVFAGVDLAASFAARPLTSDLLEFHPIPGAGPYNDQAWLYVAPYRMLPLQPSGVTFALWLYQGGTSLMVSLDGGVSWQPRSVIVSRAPLNASTFPQVPPDAPLHPLCELDPHEPTPPTDEREPNPAFARMKAGRHGGFGTDHRFHWSEVKEGDLLLCSTEDFVAWTSHRHRVHAGDDNATLLVFDQTGALFVLHMDQLYESRNQGRSIHAIHPLPKWGERITRGNDRVAQYFAVRDGVVHLGLMTKDDTVWYMRGDRSPTDPSSFDWTCEAVDANRDARFDFMQLVLTNDGRPMLSYATKPDPAENRMGGTTTAVRLAPLAPSPGTC